MFQPGLFDTQTTVSFDDTYAQLTRIDLDSTAWVDLQPGWVRGSDHLFEQLRAERPWKQRTRTVWNVTRPEPRLTAPWSMRQGSPLQPAILEAMRQSLSARYGVTFDSIGFNLYRDGNDAVAWHRDMIEAHVKDPIVVLVSLGEPRKLLLRPFGGGKSHPFPIGRGDLLVTGGSSQRTWEHTIPRVASAGPRISLAFRHGLDPRAYDRAPGSG